jgi:cation diffusion facilitator family transporter
MLGPAETSQPNHRHDDDHHHNDDHHHDDDHHHNDDHHHEGEHRHTHGVVDPSIISTERGIWAVKWSFVALMITALLQMAVVYFTGSVALLADTIHNFSDAMTAIPLWIAFGLAKRPPNRRYTYGYGRVEDLAGVIIVLLILVSAGMAGYESIQRFFNPQPVQYLWAVIVASIIGFAGNEAVALFRIKVGKEIGSAALVADGYHARTDGLTSLAVLFGAIGVWLGFPLADPLIGLVITVAILKIVWESAQAIFSRLLDGVAPDIIQEIEETAAEVAGVEAVSEVRVRWLGHRLRAEVNVAVQPDLPVSQGHQIAVEVHHQLLHHLPYLSQATIHVDPLDASGEAHHRIAHHQHDGLPGHAH